MTVILNRKSPCNPSGGRPMKLGTLLFDDNGRRGLFLGYDDQGNKIAVNDKDLSDLFQINHLTYKVKVDIVKSSSSFNLARFFAKYFVPEKLKHEIQSID